MRVAVQDANILIDLEIAELFDAWGGLRFKTHTTDFIKAQLEHGGHWKALERFDRNEIHCHSLDETAMAAVVRLMGQVSSGPDISDCSVLYLAQELDAILLTGERPLRKECGRRGIETHGTLWILDELVKACLVTPATAATKLSYLMDAGRYLPIEESKWRLSRWRKLG